VCCLAFCAARLRCIARYQLADAFLYFHLLAAGQFLQMPAIATPFLRQDLQATPARTVIVAAVIWEQNSILPSVGRSCEQIGAAVDICGCTTRES
jgi:hypothetical protein